MLPVVNGHQVSCVLNRLNTFGEIEDFIAVEVSASTAE